MGAFGDLNRDGLEESEDRIGGGSFVLDTDIYTGIIKLAYAGVAASGAKSVSLVLDFDGKEFKHTEFVTSGTSKGGKNYYMVTDRSGKETGKKRALPGFEVINDICLATTEEELFQQDTPEKVVNIYDFDQRKEVPKSVPVLVDLLGKTVSLAIQRNLENKTEVQNGERVTTNDTRDTNTIEKVFHTETKLTMNEARESKPAAFWDIWLEKNKGNVNDKTKKDAGVKSGKPAGAPPAAGGGERKSLFGNKG